MDISKIEPGSRDVVNVFITCIKGSKDFYEYDDETDNFVLKKVLNASFPGVYGFIPRTHHIDAEPLDTLILISDQIQQGIVLPARPIGVIRLRSDVPDDILVAVPISDDAFKNVNDVSKISNLDEIKKFLEAFKGLKVEDVFGSEHAKRSIETAINLYKREFE